MAAIQEQVQVAFEAVFSPIRGISDVVSVIDVFDAA